MQKIFKILIIIFLFLANFTASSLLAQDIETKALHIYENKYKEAEKEKKELISFYKETNFYNCLSCEINDQKNPFAFLKCLRETKYCLQNLDVPHINCEDGFNYSGGSCVTINEGCMEEFGIHSFYEDKKDKTGTYTCACAEGFSWNNDQSECIQSACPDGTIYYSSYQDKNGDILYGRCLDLDEACQTDYGEFSIYSHQNEYGQIMCECEINYEWDINNQCTEKIIVKGIEGPNKKEITYLETIEREINLFTKKDANLSLCLKGLILLQVEEKGEAWYFNPEDENKYFLGSPSKAFEIMKKIGLGIKHNFITNNIIFPEHVLGRILIDVEDYGKAYYIYPKDKKAYYLGRPKDAFTVMQNLGLGISNEDIRKIKVGK
jgi:hypothetical protein